MLICTSPRLRMEEAHSGHSAFIFQLLNSPNWIQFLGDRKIKTEKDALGYIEQKLIGSYQQHGLGLYIVHLLDSGKAIGLCGFVKRDKLNHPDIGFAILPKFERQGYTYEAASALMAYGREQLKLEEIMGVVDQGNIASQRLLEKLGLQCIGKTQLSESGKEILLYSDLVG
ncbi:MAG: GNAT family N-acetyltransferase [Bacteroidota bacterium]